LQSLRLVIIINNTWLGVVRYGGVSLGAVRFGEVWSGMVRSGVVWCVVVWWGAVKVRFGVESMAAFGSPYFFRAYI
jgi:hypothetical protein